MQIFVTQLYIFTSALLIHSLICIVRLSPLRAYVFVPTSLFPNHMLYIFFLTNTINIIIINHYWQWTSMAARSGRAKKQSSIYLFEETCPSSPHEYCLSCVVSYELFSCRELIKFQNMKNVFKIMKNDLSLSNQIVTYELPCSPH